MSIINSLKSMSVDAARASMAYVTGSGNGDDSAGADTALTPALDELPVEIQQQIAKEQAYDEAYQRLRAGVQVKHRKYHFKTYKNCFVGREAVDFMVESGWAKNRADAVRIGLELQLEHHMFGHVVDGEKHPFKDDYLFYRFSTDDAGDDRTSTVSSSFGEGSSSHDASSSGIGGTDELGTVSTGRASSSMSSSFTAMSPLKCGSQLGIIAIGEILREGVSCSHNYTFDASGFFAEAAVDFLVTTGLASSREDAVRIGSVLESTLGVIRNCSNNGATFQDNRTFYSFTDNSKNNDWRDDLKQARDFLRAKVQVKTHMYHLKAYKNTFLGSDVVTVLTKGVTGTREDALLVGRVMMYEYNLFLHVTDEHTLEDEALFYRYNTKYLRKSSKPEASGCDDPDGHDDC